MTPVMAPPASIVGVGLYTIPEAGRLVHAKPATVRSWVQKGLAPEPIVRRFGETTIVSFQDLISLRVVRRLTEHGISLRQVRAAEDYLRREWSFERPFATQRILTDGRSILAFLEEREEPTSVDRRGQEVIPEVIREDLVDVTFGNDRRAASWRPRTGVLLRPDLQFGAPCVEGTRIPTRTLQGFRLAGDSLEFIAESYGLRLEQVRDALDYEESLEEAA